MTAISGDFGAATSVNESAQATGTIHPDHVAGLNDHGEIVGTAYFATPDGVRLRACVLRPLPQAAR